MYIANNSRTQRSSVPNFGRKVPHLRCDSHASLKIKRSKVSITGPINVDTYRAPYLPNGKAYELQTWCTGGRRWPASTTGAMISKVKDQGRKVTWSVWAVLAQCCTCVIRGRRGHTVSAEFGGHTSCYYCWLVLRVRYKRWLPTSVRNFVHRPYRGHILKNKQNILRNTIRNWYCWFYCLIHILPQTPRAPLGRCSRLKYKTCTSTALQFSFGVRSQLLLSTELTITDS